MDFDAFLKVIRSSFTSLGE